MDRIAEVEKGQKILAKWANRLVQEIRRLKIIPGPGVRTTVTSDGTIVNVDLQSKKSETEGTQPDPALDSCFPVFITGYNGPAYKGARYKIVRKNYPAGQEIESDALYFPHVTPQTVLPMGCTVLAHRISAPLIESSED